MKILDTEIEFDFYDAEQAEKFEKYAEIATQELNNINANKIKQSVFIRTVYEIVERCFNNIFGEGIAEKIFNNKKDFHLCIKAFKDLVKSRLEQENVIAKEIDDLQKEMSEATTKYSNRATRRTKK
ncbi:MAG: hypothetical protein HFJ38_08400 [Bacilli bacterium]|nr:hypothetical protein [Bacilli bacterium]